MCQIPNGLCQNQKCEYWNALDCIDKFIKTKTGEKRIEPALCANTLKEVKESLVAPLVAAMDKFNHGIVKDDEMNGHQCLVGLDGHGAVEGRDSKTSEKEIPVHDSKTTVPPKLE